MSDEAATNATIDAAIGSDPSAGEKSNGGYEVGYGRPPRSGQFKPGRSGNPSDRRKGEKTLKSTLHAVMGEALDPDRTARMMDEDRAILERHLNGSA